MRKIIKYFGFCLAFLIMPFIFAGCFGGLFGGGDNESDGRTSLSRVSVSIEDSNYSRFADGNPKTPIVKISLNGQVYATLNQSNEDFIITYSNNVKPGKATVKISATKENKTFKGTKEWNFTIYAPTGDVGDFDALRASLASSAFNSVKLNNDITIPSDATVTIREGVTLSLNGYMLLNKGKIVNNGTISANSVSGKTSQLVAEGEIDNVNSASKIVISSGQEMYIGGTIENHSRSALHFENGSNIYANEEISSSEISGSGYNFTLRIDINTLKLEMKKTVEYDKINQSHDPDIWIYNGSEQISSREYREIYENNKKVGTATVTIKAVYASKKIFGSRTETFEIVPISIKAEKASDIQALLDNENYGQVNFAGTKISNEIVVPEGKILKLTGSCDIQSKMIIYGTLIHDNKIVANANIETKENGKVETSKNACLYIAGDISVCGNICSSKVYVNETNENCSFTGTAQIVRRIEAKESYFTVVNPKFNENMIQGSLVPKIYNDGNYVLYSHYEYQIVNSDGTAYEDDVINVGTYYYKLTATALNQKYYGTVILTYQVEPISVTVNSDYLLRSCIESNNYSEITVTAKSPYISAEGTLVIKSWQTLILSENTTLTIWGDVDVYGKIVNKGTVISAWGDQGENPGMFHVKDGGTIENTGTMYVNDCDFDITGGTVYNRKHIGDCVKFYNKNGEETDFENDVFVYGSDFNQPTVKIFINGTEIDESKNYYYYSQLSAGGNSYLYLRSNEYKSQYLYGVYKQNFTVVRGTGTTKSWSDLKDQLAPNSEGNCNYEKITLTKDIVLEDDITIPSGLVVDTDGFNFVSYSSTSPKRYFITNNGKILIDFTKNSDCSFKNEYSAESTGTVEAVASSASELQLYTNINIANCNFVLKIGADLTLSNSNFFTIADNVKNYTIDLCGHAVNFIYVFSVKNNLTIMSSLSGATIGTGSISDFTSQGSVYVRTLGENANVVVKTENISYSGYVVHTNNGGTIKEQ